MKNRTKWLSWLAALMAAAPVVAAESPGDAMLEAYAALQYARAEKLASRHPKLAEARLVKALCSVFNRQKQNLSYGLPALKKIFDDQSVKSSIRIEAGLAYARAAQTLQMRPGVYPVAEGIDYNKVYDAIVAGNPDSAAAVFAAIYQAQEWFDSKDGQEVNKGFERLNGILRSYRGPKPFLSPVHYMLADQYIIHGGNYARAVGELETALLIGVANPRNREQTTFRIARLYHANLKDPSRATVWYRRFLKEFPNSSSAPLARRYLREMTEGKKENGNG